MKMVYSGLEGLMGVWQNTGCASSTNMAVLSAERIICLNDDEAAGRALSIFKPGIGFGYQVVEGTRIVKTSRTTTTITK